MAFELYATKKDVIQTMTYDQLSENAGLRFFGPDGAENVTRFSDTQVEIELGHGQGFYRNIENLLYAIQHDYKQPTMADVVDGARAIAVVLAAERSAVTGNAENVEDFEPLAYKGAGEVWRLDDYQRDMLREFVPLYTQERRSALLGWNIKPTKVPRGTDGS